MFLFIRRFLLVLSAASLAQYHDSLSIGPFAVTINKLITAVLLVVAGFQVVVGPRGFPRNTKNLWILGMAVALVISVVNSVAQGIPLSGLLRVSSQYVSVFLFYFLLAYVVRDRRDLDLLFWGLTVGTVVVCVTGFLGIGVVAGAGEFERYGGIGGNPNTLGYTASAVLPLSIALLIGQKSIVRRFIVVVAVTVILAGILNTLSRSAFVSVAAMGLYWCLRSGRLDLLRYAWVPVAVGLAVAVVAPQGFYARIGTMTSAEAREQDSSIQGRLGDYSNAMRAFLSNPITGVGFYRFGVWAHENLDWRIGTRKAIHNAYLRVAADQGLMGLIPFGAILFLTWRDLSRVQAMARRRQDSSPELKRLGREALLVQTAFLGTLIGNVFCPALRYKMPWLLYALSTVMLAMSVSALRARDAPLEASLNPRPYHPWPDRVPSLRS
jgi:O-antigen ligase